MNRTVSVIASVAKQSSYIVAYGLDCRVAVAPRNDEGGQF